ncbi:kinase domain protein (macronuclear) [Tetrahymena thermophila SB210]|uniref:Kinase domain protein n=1 Tax=Tetrahymena thermophila (strain SB210) TaxID=312017 RepID=Q23K23_TETTS|nr:kinase domain protein [Tetrahymena thermophila SB210]EAR97020.1 kinase domain protein [Tetrahymena thermophila SB210]|eukprot:XP_001017265.1 kinase domain protein [Tetrahymena thermophila SB210]
MTNRVNYLYSDYKGYGLQQGISLTAQKNGAITQTSSFNYQPVAKENISTLGQISNQPLYQQIQYSTQSGRTVQRTASPMIIQHPSRYGTNNANLSTSPNQSSATSATKYQVPSYQNNGGLSTNFSYSAEKSTTSNGTEAISRPSIGASYLSSQNNNQFNNSQALRSPYVSSFTSNLTSSQMNGTSNSNSNPSGAQVTHHHGRSISMFSGQNYTAPSIAQSLSLSIGTQSNQPSSTNQSSLASGNVANLGNNQNNSTSFSQVYTSLSANNKVALNNNLSSGVNGQIVGDRSISYTGSSAYPQINTQSIENFYQQNSQPSNEQLNRSDSLSPSKRVTFNLARNTYTDIEQIEKRLNESTRLRPADEVEDSRDRTPTATFGHNHIYEDDLSKRFDQAIFRSERIISDCLRIGREGQQYKNALENSTVANGSTTPNGPKMIRNPSRSKSPIKSSLKRTSSFTGSPQKSVNTTPSTYQAAQDTNLAASQNLQKFSDAFENPLTNQTNKIINNIHTTTETIYSSKQAASPYLQSNSSSEKTPQSLTNNSASTVVSSTNSSQISVPSYLAQTSSLNSQNPEKQVPLSSQTTYVSSSTKQVGLTNSVTDENQFVASSSNVNKAITSSKPYSAQENGISSSVYSVTSAYNTSLLSSTQNTNPQKASYLSKVSSSKENEQQSVSSQNKAPSQVEFTSIALKKSESEVVDQNQNKQDKQQNDAKRLSLQPTSATKPRQGILRYSDGSRYDGEILNNQRHGYGTLLSSDFQVIYQGDWQNDTYHGQGKFFNPLAENLFDEYEYSDFDVALSQYWESYEGEFYEGKLDGFGTLMLTNGEKLVGNFKKGRICGKGTFYCNKGPAVTGNWEDNRLLEKY